MSDPIRDSDIFDGQTIFYMKFVGIWKIVNTYRTSGKMSLVFRLEWYLTLLLSVPFQVLQVISPYYIEVDLEKATILILNTVSFLHMVAKHGTFWWNIKGHAELFRLMTKDVLSSIPQYKRTEAKKIYKDATKRCNFYCKMIITVTYSVWSMWTFNPSVKSDYILFHTGNMKDVTTGPKKILGGWYPVPFSESPWTEIVYIYEAVLLLWCAVIVSIFDTVVTQEVIGLYAHMSVLNFHISTLTKEEVIFHSKKEIYSEQEAEDLMLKEFIAIIRDHQYLLRCGKILKDSYNTYITALLLAGGNLMIITVFQFFYGKKDIPTTINFVFYLSYGVMEISLLCWTTTLLETASTNIAFSIYSSDWYTYNTKLRNIGRMMMLRSEKPLSLAGFKVYHVNLETLMNIMQFTYSSSALMSRMVE
nr:odorant receptor 24 [Graphosoma rubrolineatum]